MHGAKGDGSPDDRESFSALHFTIDLNVTWHGMRTGARALRRGARGANGVRPRYDDRAPGEPESATRVFHRTLGGIPPSRRGGAGPGPGPREGVSSTGSGASAACLMQWRALYERVEAP